MGGCDDGSDSATHSYKRTEATVCKENHVPATKGSVGKVHTGHDPAEIAQNQAFNHAGPCRMTPLPELFCHERHAAAA